MPGNRPPIRRGVCVFWFVVLTAVPIGIFDRPEGYEVSTTAAVIGYASSLLAFGALIEFFRKRGA